MAKSDTLWKLLERDEIKTETAKTDEISGLPACIRHDQPSHQGGDEAIPPAGSSPAVPEKASISPPDPALLAQFRAAMEMFEHYSLEHDKINERVQNGVQYLRDNLKDEQSKKWVDEVQTWPAGGIAQGTTFDALAHRVKVNQPALSAILQHWRDLLRQRETQRQHAEWEAFAQHDIEKTLRAQTGQSSGTVCVNCWQWIAEVYGEHHAACRGWKSDGE